MLKKPKVGDIVLTKTWDELVVESKNLTPGGLFIEDDIGNCLFLDNSKQHLYDSLALVTGINGPWINTSNEPKGLLKEMFVEPADGISIEGKLKLTGGTVRFKTLDALLPWCWDKISQKHHFNVNKYAGTKQSIKAIFPKLMVQDSLIILDSFALWLVGWPSYFFTDSLLIDGTVITDIFEPEPVAEKEKKSDYIYMNTKPRYKTYNGPKFGELRENARLERIARREANEK